MSQCRRGIWLKTHPLSPRLKGFMVAERTGSCFRDNQ